MNTRNKLSPRLVQIAFCTLGLTMLSSCGGGADGAAVEAPSGANITPPTVPGGPVTGAPVVDPVPAVPMPVVPLPEPIPEPPDLSIPPPPVVAGPPSVDVDPSLPDTPTPLPPVIVGPPIAVTLPTGAVLCQPATCPPYAVNGSVTNGTGASDPTGAGGYLLPSTETAGGEAPYPDLRSLPLLVLPFEPVTIGEAPIVTDARSAQ